MTTAENIRNLYADRDKGVANLAAKGVTVSTTAGLSEIMDKILEIKGDTVTGTLINNSVSLRKAVPIDSAKYAYLNSIGGMTYKIPDTFIATVTEVWNGGAEDQPTLPSKIEFEYVPSIPFQLPAPTEYGGHTFHAIIDASEFVGPGYDGYYLYPKTVYINDSTTPVVDLWNFPSDVVIRKISGTLADDGQALLFDVPVGTQFVCTPDFTSMDDGTVFYPPAPLRNAKPTAIKSYKADGALLAEYTLPTAITDKLGLGYDANLFNEYSFVDKEATEKVSATTISGTSSMFSVVKNRDRAGYRLPKDATIIEAIQNDKKANLLIPIFGNDYSMSELNNNLSQSGKTNLAWQVGGQYYSNYQNAWFFFPEGTFGTKEEAEAWFNERQLTLVYELAHYVITPVTTDFNPLIEVEGGGYLEFVNEYGQPVPSTVTFTTISQ